MPSFTRRTVAKIAAGLFFAPVHPDAPTVLKIEPGPTFPREFVSLSDPADDGWGPYRIRLTLQLDSEGRPLHGFQIDRVPIGPEEIDRPEAPGSDHPRPVKTDLHAGVVLRTWAPGDVDRCRLCARGCRAQPTVNGGAVCAVMTPPEIKTVDQAELFTARFPNEHHASQS